MSPDIFSDLTFLKILLPNDATDDGISICVSKMQPLKAESPIEATDDGIVICVS